MKQIITNKFSQQKMEACQNLTSEHQSDVMSDNVYQERIARKKQRDNRVSVLKIDLDSIIVRPNRKPRWMFFFVSELLVTTIGVLINAQLLLGERVDSLLLSEMIWGTMSFTIVTATIGNLQVTNLLTMLKLYFHLDDMMPAISAATIGFLTLLDFIPEWTWQTYAICVTYPIWMVVFAGTLRVHVLCEQFSKWQIIAYKVTMFFCGVVNFYIGFSFMNGAYRVTNGLVPSIENTYKNIIYIYIFGLMEYLFELIRRLSDFDQTSDLKINYDFKSRAQREADIFSKIHRRETKEIDIILEEVITFGSRRSQQLGYERPSPLETDHQVVVDRRAGAKSSPCLP